MYLDGFETLPQQVPSYLFDVDVCNKQHTQPFCFVIPLQLVHYTVELQFWGSTRTKRLERVGVSERESEHIGSARRRSAQAGSRLQLQVNQPAGCNKTGSSATLHSVRFRSVQLNTFHTPFTLPPPRYYYPITTVSAKHDLVQNTSVQCSSQSSL